MGQSSGDLFSTHVPKFDRIVLAARSQRFAVRRVNDASDDIRMTGKRMQLITLAEIPKIVPLEAS